MNKIIDFLKRIGAFFNEYPSTFIWFAALCFALPYFWKSFLFYLIMPGSFALTAAIYIYAKKLIQRFE